MKKRHASTTLKVVFSSALIALTGCIGATVSNTDKPQGAYVAGAKPVVGASSVQIVETSPPNAGQLVEGVSCKNKMWDPEPSAQAAIEVAKNEAAKYGYTKLRIVEIIESGAVVDWQRNCWSTVIARGIAFN